MKMELDPEEMESFLEKERREEAERREYSFRMLSQGKARPYLEVLEDLNCHTGSSDYKKLRRLHRELKVYGDGVPLFDRINPVWFMLPVYIVVGAMAIMVAITILKVIYLITKHIWLLPW